MSQHIFIYEYVTGGGTFGEPASPPPAGSLLREGAAMVAALADDFLQLDETQVSLLRDTRLSDLRLPPCREIQITDRREEQQALIHESSAADWTVLIAPEFDEILLDRCRLVEECGGRLLSPPSPFVRFASDKNATADRLKIHNVPTAQGRPFLPGQSLPRDFPYPAVLKPHDGAGSMGVQYIAAADAEYNPTTLGTLARLEAFVPGLPASVSLLCGSRRAIALPACVQWLSDDGSLRYQGGATPVVPGDLQRRAQQLAQRALAACPPAIGYVGVDLILGAANDGSLDTVIEINPRLTTSYTGLRRLACTNLASAMLAAAQGFDFEMGFHPHRVRFTADGRTSIHEAETDI